MYSKDIESILREVVNNSDEYSQSYIARFGVTQATISRLRNGKRDISNMKLPTIKKILNAYEYKNNAKIKDQIRRASNNTKILNEAKRFANEGDLARAVNEIKLIIIHDNYDDKDMVDQFKNYNWMLHEIENVAFSTMYSKQNDDGTALINLNQDNALSIDMAIFDYLNGSGIKFKLSGNFNKLERGFARKYVLNESEVKDKMFYFDGENLTTLTADKLTSVIDYLNEKYGD